MKMNDAITFDLSDFGYREIKEAIEILERMLREADNDIEEAKDLKLAFNRMTGFVFLIDGENNIYMINKETNRLEKFYVCDYCGAVGFKNEIINIENHENKKECLKFIKSIRC